HLLQHELLDLPLEVRVREKFADVLLEVLRRVVEEFRHEQPDGAAQLGVLPDVLLVLLAQLLLGRGERGLVLLREEAVGHRLDGGELRSSVTGPTAWLVRRRALRLLASGGAGLGQPRPAFRCCV
ncbi:unnamed protein product, partial [Pelagomonas calceolata]